MITNQNGVIKSDVAQWFSIVNKEGSDAAEVLIYSQIGKDYWSNDGVDDKEFSDALKQIDATKLLRVRLNSPGGNVYVGLSIANQLIARGNFETIIDGMAASIASVIFVSAKKRTMPKASGLMIHDPATIAQGGVKEMLIAIAGLENAKKMIVAAYKTATGKSEKVLESLMEATSYFTGDEAMSEGFATHLTDAQPVTNSFDLSIFGNVPEAFRKLTNSAPKGGQPDTLMNRAQIIARLKKLGETVDDKSTDEQLIAQLDAAIAKAMQPPPPTPPAAPPAATVSPEMAAVQAQLTAMRRKEYAARIDAAIQDRKITAKSGGSWLARAMVDETILAEIEAMEPNIPPAGISGGSLEVVSEAPEDAAKGIAKIGNEIIADIGKMKDREAVSKCMARALAIRKHLDAFGQSWHSMKNEGTNTIDTALKQDVIIDIALRAYARVLAPLSAFSTMFSNVALRGTNKIQVPFLDLDATTPTQWVAANGYVAGDTTNDNREITVDKRYYIAMRYTSEELARQPFLMVKEQVELKAESMAFYVWKDFLALFTTANYDIATGWPKAAGAMDSNSIADLQGIADGLGWPEPGRQLFVNSVYDIALKKDNAFKIFSNFGSNEVMRDGRLTDVYGFTYTRNANLPDNSINLAGIIAAKAAALFATAPIPPTEGVIRDGTKYSMVVDPQTGIPLEYREFGESKYDRETRVVEANWGKAVGNASAAKLLTSA